MDDPRAELEDAQIKFGYVPTGICELALLENQTLQKTFNIDQAMTLSCEAVTRTNF
ncbi:MAG: hypothetical protein H7061_03120 [Bdellovibrionaceae bacterium]|nr:hypothetical protein [Bdellovibrio sp.]